MSGIKGGPCGQKIQCQNPCRDPCQKVPICVNPCQDPCKFGIQNYGSHHHHHGHHHFHKQEMMTADRHHIYVIKDNKDVDGLMIIRRDHCPGYILFNADVSACNCAYTDCFKQNPKNIHADPCNPCCPDPCQDQGSYCCNK